MSATTNEPGGDGWLALPLPDADIRYAQAWLRKDEADAWFERLLHDIPWERHRLKLFGREVDCPRLSCWIGDPGAAYVYSQTRFEPHPWTPALQSLRERVQASCGASFNSVLANLYRNGEDSMGWHSDDEPELGPQPVIASLSLGVERRFRLRRKSLREAKAKPLGLPLAHGSLLYVAGDTQSHYQHDLPKLAGLSGARINLTFRFIHGSAQRRP
ncbi:alpha-ketoglutarate-dependent dioxygenase AlkB family protein [Dyella mobilis]|uniref:Alpha-ketoglutarate-dependent dioxygenase AlkB n=1 Tax=Dyella mobilis TaxID=1849582 RepID=A0ABS2KMF3_9GAMM|nr:alpha-ketoglutarate-dependent dioxygenase AlkB [Dyella mobilis]MBM7132331.1 alpha-ketoglutarate-dependent dioxygenase AlkB [Dyella mobilis]GLQ95681.1 DNA methylase [Dyella mobilis]